MPENPQSPPQRFLAQRQLSHELMDQPGADDEILVDSLRFIRQINRFLGYTRATLHHLKRFSQRWKPGESITIADLGTGSGDIPLAIVQWARQSGFNVRILALDLHEKTVAAALAHTQGEPNITILRGNVLQMPIAPGSVDYAIASMFLHHLPDAEVTAALSAMNQISRRGILFADLVRHPVAYWTTKLMTLASNPMVRNDAPASVAQGFTRQEVMELGRKAGINYADYFPHAGYRFVFCGEKQT